MVELVGLVANSQHSSSNQLHERGMRPPAIFRHVKTGDMLDARPSDPQSSGVEEQVPGTFSLTHCRKTNVLQTSSGPNGTNQNHSQCGRRGTHTHGGCYSKTAPLMTRWCSAAHLYQIPTNQKVCNAIIVENTRRANVTSQFLVEMITLESKVCPRQHNQDARGSAGTV